MVNSCHSSYYFPLVSGSVGQELYSFNSCSKKHYPHGKFVIFEKFVFNYFPLVSGSGGQNSLYSFNSCSKRIHHPHGKIRVIQDITSLWSVGLRL